MPSWVAARPTPIPSRMIAIIRSTSARSSGPNSLDRRGPALQHRVAELDHLGERRFAALQPLGLELGSARPRSASRCVLIGSIARSNDAESRGGLTSPRVLLRVDVDADRDVAQRPLGGQALDHAADRGDRALAV